MKIKPSLLKRVSLNLYSKYAVNQAKLHELTYLGWESTLRCNANCLHCGSDCTQSSVVPDMPADDFLKVAEEVRTQFNPKNVMVGLAGGEPLMRNDLDYIGKELVKMGYKWGIVTNGILLNNDCLHSLLNAGIASIAISLDGFATEHNWLRGVDIAYDRAINAIKTVAPYKNDITFDVITCVSKKNLPIIKNIKQHLLELGVNKWRIFDIDPIGRAGENHMLQLNKEEFISLLNQIVEMRNDKDMHIQYCCHDYLGNYENKVRDGYTYCISGINIATILVDGSITGCANVNHKYIQGNIYKDKFLDVWNNRFELYRDRKWMKNGTCTNCNDFTRCQGNGMHLRDTNGEILTCHYKNII